MVNVLERELSRSFEVNRQPRCACVLLLDTSGSMAGERIAALNSGLATLVAELRKDALATKRADLAILTFDSEVKLVQDFTSADRFEAPTLTAQGTTALGAGVCEALDRIAARKQEYKDNDVGYYRPWLFILTDGGASDSTEEAKARLARAQAEKRVKVFPIGVGEADLKALGALTGAAPMRLDESKFVEMFEWLSVSLGKKAHSQEGRGDGSEAAVTLDPTSTWGHG